MHILVSVGKFGDLAGIPPIARSLSVHLEKPSGSAVLATDAPAIYELQQFAFLNSVRSHNTHI